MTPFLEITDLLIHRSKHPVLEIDHLSVEKGQILAVVGPNGAGKTTLLLALARLIHPEHGEIWLGGRPVRQEPDTAYRRRLALVMQDPLLFDTNVYDNIAAGLHFRGIPKKEIEQRVQIWLERLGIAHLRTRRAVQLSGGESQRVSLARALVLEPQLLLLDETFAPLDPPTRSHLIDDLGKLLNELQITTIFITHDLAEAARLADKIAILLDGKLRQCGTPGEIVGAPAGADIAAFLGGYQA